ncbi:MAG: biotin/lipoyl-containing protein [Myxococcota bacterium]
MAVDVLLPSYSESMEEADVIGWLVAPGDPVSQGDPIAEIETDKATGELESPVSGVLVEICVPEGTAGVKVGTVVARIETEGNTQSAATASASEAELPPPTENEADASPEAATGEEPAIPETPPEPAPSTEDAEPPAEATEQPMAAPEKPPPGVAVTALARRLAEQQGIDLHVLRGTGHRGRILKSDIEAAATATHPSASGAFAASDSLVRLEVDCKIDRALAVCTQLGSREDREDIPLIAVILRAAAMALQETPELNAARDGNSVAAEGEAGIRLQLLTEDAGSETTAGSIHVEGANRKSLSTIADEIESGPGTPGADPEGSTSLASAFMVLDVRALGIERVQPALADPGVACLGIGAPTPQVVADDDAPSGARFVPTIHCSLAVDSRAVETRAAARWLQNFRTRLEDPLELLL